jgi:PHP family Zn ribbon phosphoesterase
MNAEQIIKALEHCINNPLCDNCPVGVSNCHITEDALALIKELQAHIENLKRENKYLRERLAEEMEHKEDMRVEAEWMVKAYKGDEIVNIPYIEHQHQYDAPFCSRCRKYALLDGVEKCVASNYCPHCGAKMKGE